jgi:hypothetical protein
MSLPSFTGLYVNDYYTPATGSLPTVSDESRGSDCGNRYYAVVCMLALAVNRTMMQNRLSTL